MILAMLSGGLDSTGMLVKLLTTTNEPLLVHHIIIKNVENRWKPELAACDKIVNYCQKNYRPFQYTKNVFGFNAFPRFYGWDNDIVRFIAAQIVKNDETMHSVALGKCKEDDDSLAFSLRAVQAHAIWRSCFFDTRWRPPGIIRPVGDMTKKQIAESIPPELFAMTFSCRNPIHNETGWHRCYKCRTCLQMKEQGLI